MKHDKNKIQEPFNPEVDTPQPPQIKDPSIRQERDEDDKPVEDSKRQPKNTDKTRGPVKKDGTKELGDEMEITDETTI